jgi:nitric oxide reductase subunit B
MQHRKLWLGLGAVVLVSFLVLGGQGVRISRTLPPIPEKVMTPDGTVLLTGESIMRGQNVWQSIGGQLIAGVGGLVWYLSGKKEDEEPTPPAKDPFSAMQLTPSQRATGKYFLVVVALFLAQVGLGGVTAHFGVEGAGFYGVPLAKYLPYAVTRSWHTQLGIFWIATAWLATGLFVGPAVSGVEPKYQRAGVNFLFVCLLIIVVGALFGQWASVQQRMGSGDYWYWFGHQGWEYVDLGRFWQIFLFVGLFVWLFLTARSVWPALKKPSEGRPLLVLFVISSLAIASFYGAGLMYGQRIFLSSGIIGTFHHLYFSGTPASAMALGATFSALEVVPLVLVGREVWGHIRLSKLPGWMEQYRWPILFFIGVAFWNLVGAGLFGFLINPPIALYYMQGLNLTPLHGHTALFGVYGMLGIALMLFSFRMMQPDAKWKTKPLAWAFWSINAGLVLMVVLSLLPIGVLQTQAAIEQGTWWARSAEFMQTPLMDTLRWLRVPGDVLFAVGALLLAWFVVGLKTGWSLERAEAPGALPEPERLGAAAPAHAVLRRR